MAQSDPNKIPAEIAKMTFEQALESLEEIVDRLEGGDVSLEESIETYTRGTHLKRHCEAKLQTAKERVEKIELEPDGTLTVHPAELD
jgi:exodeoxyribonuclease VII small subunit